tara:strand:+ start:184 stop:465 length:282 start_codon:yes stop_codon:yes gene_type:complete
MEESKGKEGISDMVEEVKESNPMEGYLEQLLVERDMLLGRIMYIKEGLAKETIPEHLVDINEKQLHPMGYYAECLNVKIGMCVSRKPIEDIKE